MYNIYSDYTDACRVVVFITYSLGRRGYSAERIMENNSYRQAVRVRDNLASKLAAKSVDTVR